MRAWRLFSPSEPEWRGAAGGAACVTLVLLFSFAHELTAGAWTALTIAVVVSLGVGFGVASGLGIVLANTVASRIPRFALGTITGCVIVLSTLVFGRRNPQVVSVLVLGSLIPTMVLGAGVLSLLGPGPRSRGYRVRRIVGVVSVVVGLGSLLAGITWYLWPGPHVMQPINAAMTSGAPVDSVSAEDPSAPGPYKVRMITYGAGTDRYRPEYGAKVGLRTQPVDGSFLLPSWQGLTGWLRSQFWGFGPDRLPINGRVWYPEGPGPFPLVLVVHGNHHMMDFSDPGYEYLCELLASRGIIAASVGENFLNMSWTDIRMFGIRGLVDEEAARGWILLKNLEEFRRWNDSPNTPFTGKVDLDRIGLIGHSRGGEAAVVAAELNWLPCYPEDARHPFDFGFHIRSIVAIAPSDGIYTPAGHDAAVDSLDYMTIQGGYDGDVTPFAGIRQYNRIPLSHERFHFKTAIYVDRANHGQFNSTWGRADRSGFPDKGLLNLSSILPQEAQQQIAKVYISAFLESSLRDDTRYLPLFRDARAGARWLPSTVYLSRYSDTKTRTIANFEEDANPFTASEDGAALRGVGLSVWREGRVALKYGDANTHAAYLGWDHLPGGGTPRYEVLLRDAWRAPRLEDAVVFSLADIRLSFAGTPANTPTAPAERDRPGTGDPLDLTVVIEDRDGHQARVPLDTFSLLQPQLEYYPLKARMLKSSDGLPHEPTFQRFEFPLRQFTEANPALDISRLSRIALEFDRSPSGVLEIDNIGIREP